MKSIKLSSITSEIRHCKSIFSKARGLMFTRKNPNRSVVFYFSKPAYSPLHMYGVFYSIDVIFLGENKKIIEIKENFKPFTFYNPKSKANYIIELPRLTVLKNKLDIGDVIEFQQ